MASIDIYNQDKKRSLQLILVLIGILRFAKAVSMKLRCGIWRVVGQVLLLQKAGLRLKVVEERYRQKGTGNARHADRQANIFVGGGIVFGPKPRDWSYSIPKKERRIAINSLLIHKLQHDKLRVLESLDFGEVKTKKAKDFFIKWKIDSALVVLDKPVDSVVKSVRNLPYFKVCSASSLNAADMLLYDFVVFTKPALEIIEERWAQKR